MKKVFSLIVVVTIALVAFSACSKDDEQEASLKGTVWTSSRANGKVWVLEFTGNNTVEFYGADTNLNQSGDTYTGTYAVNGNAVTFNLKCAYYQRNNFKKGIINGNSMEVYYDWGGIVFGDNGSDDYPYSDTTTFRKR